MSRQRLEPGSVVLVADHGLALVYFLQTSVVPRMLEAGLSVVLLTDDQVVEHVRQRFARPGLSVLGLRMEEAIAFVRDHRPERQWWLHFLRRVSGSTRINTEAMDSYIDQVATEQSNWRRIWMPLARILIAWLRRSKTARRQLVAMQQRIRPGLYADLFERTQPSLVVASTPGWRMDRFLLREAHAAGYRTATVILGWDNPSSYAVPGAEVDWATCWSEIQRQELVLGSDWDAAAVHIGGIPIYDGYLSGEWRQPRQAYFQQHGLDESRKLISYACSFISFAPNWPNVQALANLISDGRLGQPCQLLVRLHPNHFLDVHLFRQERERILALAAESAYISVVEPVPIGGSLGHYSGEDVEEKASMLAHSDVFVTVYSTMVVEAAIHDRPIVSLVLDEPGGWNWPRKYSLPLSEIGNWPTHQRFRQSGAGLVAETEAEAAAAISAYLRQPEMHRSERAQFVQREITFTDGSAGRRTADYLIQLAEQAAR